jgi:hypothetical protein
MLSFYLDFSQNNTTSAEIPIVPKIMMIERPAAACSDMVLETGYSLSTQSSPSVAEWVRLLLSAKLISSVRIDVTTGQEVVESPLRRRQSLYRAFLRHQNGDLC